MKQVERIDDFIKTFGSMTSADHLECSIGNFSARMSEAMNIYPIKRVEVRRKSKNRYGDRPIYFRYYYEKNKCNIKSNEEVLRWLDE